MESQKSLTYPSVSIIFPNYNGGAEPLECLESIKKLNYPKDKIETIVIDNNSHDGSDREIKKRFPSVKLIKNKQNIGFAPAVNMGIQKAGGKYIFIGNDDIILERNSLKTLIEYSLKNPKAGVLGGKIFYKSDPKKICSRGYMMNKFTGDVYVSGGTTHPDWVQGCALLVPKKVLTKIGPLDAGYKLSFDDYDLCQRTRSAGFDVIYVPQAVFWHGESVTVDKNKPHKYYHWYKSKFRFLIKNMPVSSIVSILLFQILIATPYHLIQRDGRFIPFLKGLIWNIKHLSQTLKLRNA